MAVSFARANAASKALSIETSDREDCGKFSIARPKAGLRLIQLDALTGKPTNPELVGD
jgi:hypothetical protein